MKSTVSYNKKLFLQKTGKIIDILLIFTKLYIHGYLWHAQTQSLETVLMG